MARPIRVIVGLLHHACSATHLVMEIHQLLDLGPRCMVCLRTFSSIGNLNRHKRTVHLRKRRFNCDTCNTFWPDKFELRRHVRNVHSGLRPYLCTRCPCSFKQQAHLTRHLTETHVGKAHHCEQCAATFASRGTLTRHQKKFHNVSVTKE